jgi:arylsulfatase
MVIASLSGLLAFFGSGSLRAEVAPSLPNVIVIFCDDLGYGDIGAFGCKAYSTPRLDEMAREGRVMSNFHVAQAVCSASRAALLTGCYSNRLGIHGALSPASKVGISDEELTMAEMFKAKGYATGMAGKWHLGHHPAFLPLQHGFDEYYGLPYSNDMWPFHPEAKPGVFPPLPLYEGNNVIDSNVTADEQKSLTGSYTDRAVRFIERNKDRPFFFYLAHSMPHVPLFVSDRFAGKSGAGLYGDVIQEIDASVGAVLDALKRVGVDNKTIVVFSSDNGPWLSYGNHAGTSAGLREGKGTSWEGGTRVPFIARWPGRIPADTRTNEMAMTIDLLPTFAKLIGGELPTQTIDGRDIWPLLSGAPDAKGPHTSYWSYYANNELQAIFSGDGRWKLVLPHSYRTLGSRSPGVDGRPAGYGPAKVLAPELYNLEIDRGETRNIAEAHPEIVERLSAEAEAARFELGDSLTRRVGRGQRQPGRVP